MIGVGGCQQLIFGHDAGLLYEIRRRVIPRVQILGVVVAARTVVIPVGTVFIVGPKDVARFVGIRAGRAGSERYEKLAASKGKSTGKTAGSELVIHIVLVVDDEDRIGPVGIVGYPLGLIECADVAVVVATCVVANLVQEIVDPILKVIRSIE